MTMHMAIIHRETIGGSWVIPKEMALVDFGVRAQLFLFVKHSCFVLFLDFLSIKELLGKGLIRPLRAL